MAVNKVTNKIYVPGLTPYIPAQNWVTVLDGNTLSTATVPTGTNPVAVAVNEATNKIYVANNGSGASGDLGSVSVIDGATNSTATIVDPNASAPCSVAVNSRTNKIYVTNCSSDNVTVIDGATNSTRTITDPNAKGLAPWAVVVNPTTNRIYVMNIGTGNGPPAAGKVTVIDGATNATSTITDPVGISPNAIAVNTVANRIYVANYGGSITVIDGATSAVTNVTDPNATRPFALAVNSTTNKVYVANETSNNVTVLDGSTNSTTTITDPTALYPIGVAVDEATNRIYVVNYGGLGTPGSSLTGVDPGSITIIDGGTNSTATIIDANLTHRPHEVTAPFAVAVDPSTDQIYVLNSAETANSSGTLIVIGGDVAATAHTLAVLVQGPFFGVGTVTSIPSGIDCGATCAQSISVGNSVALTATPLNGLAFAGWSGACTGTGPCEITMNADEFVTATFGAPVTVPNVVGQTETAARRAIGSAGLAVGTVTQQSSGSIASGLVISESPPAGTTAASGSTVNLVVSSGDPSAGGGGRLDLLTLGSLLACLLLLFRRAVVLQ